MTSGGDFSTLHRTICPDGTVRWLSGAGRVLLGPDGKPVRGVGISQNVTGRKRAEAELIRLNDEIQLQRLRVFKATMRTVQDIVNNLLKWFPARSSRGREPTARRDVDADRSDD